MRRWIAFLVSCLLLVGCEGLRLSRSVKPFTLLEKEHVDRTVTEWLAAGLPLPMKCELRARDERVLVASAEATDNWCTGGTGHVHGCFLVYRNVIVQREGDNVIVHETLHALSQCVFGDYDSTHTARKVLWEVIEPRAKNQT
jgi:hypothetical protein